MEKWQGYLPDVDTIRQVHHVSGSYLGGHPIGIIAVDMGYPKLPGNVVNASTYSYPVLYKKVSFQIEQLFAGDPGLREMIVNAARELAADGVRAIVGACGYFAHFQKDVAAAVDVPVFMSSLCQLSMIKLGLRAEQKILVLCASGDSFNQDFLSKVNARMEDCIIQDVGSMESFAGIRWDGRSLDNGKLTDDLAALAARAVAEHPEVGAILLECSDLPPYAYAIQAATGLPVFDFISMIDWIEKSVVQKPYFGFF